MKKLICTTLLIEKSPQALPLGAACIASAVKNDSRTKGIYEVELFDFCSENSEIEQISKVAGDSAVGSYIAKKLASKNPSAILFSVYVWNHIALEKAAEEIKRLCPSVITIAGGPEVTADPFVFSGFDYTTAGAGESATPELLSKIHKEALLKDYHIPGIYFLSGNREQKQQDYRQLTPERALPCPPQNLPSPYLDGTLDPSKYGGALWELARGCPFKCSYCYESKGESRVSYFPMERLEKEIDLFSKKKIPQVFVLDPTYNASKERALKMLSLIKKKTPGTFYYFEARAEFIDRELAAAFRQVKCALQIGLQSADAQVLKNVHRTLDKKKFSRNIGFLNDAGVTFGFDLIYGLPGDTLKGFKSSIDYALSLFPNNLELFCLSVLPGTDLHDDAKSFGMEWQQFPPYHVLRTPQFPKEDLAKAAALAQATNLFYTQGRAVSWFNCVIYHLHKKASVFLEEFEKYLKDKNIAINDGSNIKPAKIRDFQKEFVKSQFEKTHILKYLPIAIDLITLYGALSDADGDGATSTITLRYWPEDILSEYAMDFPFFTANAQKHNCTVKVFPNPAGAKIKII